MAAFAGTAQVVSMVRKTACVPVPVDANQGQPDKLAT
jgi:hypothetical protein